MYRRAAGGYSVARRTKQERSMSQYPPTGQPLYYDTPPKRRPTSVTVIAVLAIIFGSIWALMSLCSIPQWLGVNFMPNPVMDDMRKDTVLVTYTLGSMLLGLVLSIMELWGGIGALSLKPSARRTLKIYAWGRIGLSVLEIVFSLALMERTKALTARTLAANPNLNTPQMQQFAEMGYYFGFALSILVLIWPVLVLIYMNRPHVKAAFEEGGAYSQQG
jgi:hypothetical protein